MKKIEIQKTVKPFGFGKSEQKTLEAVKFKNGKIAYLDDDEIRTLNSVDDLKSSSDLKIVEKA